MRGRILTNGGHGDYKYVMVAALLVAIPMLILSVAERGRSAEGRAATPACGVAVAWRTPLTQPASRQADAHQHHREGDERGYEGSAPARRRKLVGVGRIGHGQHECRAGIHPYAHPAIGIRLDRRAA